MEKVAKGFDKEKIFRFPGMIQYSDGGIVSRQVIKTEHGNVSLFSFDAGEGLSEHSAPFDALVQVIEGTAGITIGGKMHTLDEGDSIIMPASVPHAVHAPRKFKMILTMIK
ncbi:MAG: cupin domain-containing protein [Chlorobi bacterium]|nr:cupin domain-containing protein [Chlorobiota bacterium]